jgi:hypothetical protein
VKVKSLVKYYFSLFVLLSVGYTQVLAPLSRGSASDSHRRQSTGYQYVGASSVKTTTTIEGLEIEEELKRNFSKEHAPDNEYVDYIFGTLSQQFLLRVKKHSPSSGDVLFTSSFCQSSLTAPDILRL